MSAPGRETAWLPRELVLASAGTGKTFRIASRIIALLAAGVPADDVFASTFTRKAAGEILDRVLERLAAAALDATAAAELAEHASLDGGAAPPADTGFWLELLERLVRRLHRFDVGTLDAFVVRTAGSFAEEAGLPPGWRIAGEPTAARLRAEALQDVLGGADRGMLVELLRAAAGGDARRSVHQQVLGELDALLEIRHALDPDAPDPWDGFAGLVEPPPSDLAERARLLADRFRAVPPPLTKSGTPRKNWVDGLRQATDAVEHGDWEAMLELTLCQRAREEGAAYDRVAVPDEVCRLVADACVLARAAIGARLASRGRMLGRLVERYVAALERRQQASGAYGFADLTRLIGGPEPLCGRPDLHYRLDARIRHVLLDEFQDTSLAQWEVLRPIVAELLAGHEGERAAVIVADPKQSIYAWRGGEPLLVRHLAEHYGLPQDRLNRSWRSSQVVLDLVNRVFLGVEHNPVWDVDPAAVAAVATWASAFSEHQAVKPLPGHVRIEVGPADDGRGTDRPRLCRRAAERVADLSDAVPGRSVGVLTRTNRTVARIMMELRRLGVAASEEGGNPLTDTAPVAALLALLRLVDHPGDAVSRYHVARSPLGDAVGLLDHRDTPAARRVADRLRRRLLHDGYGRTLAALVARVQAHCDARERRRLQQLVELGFRYDPDATLRAVDFVHLVESERVESPSDANARVMTIHQAKGLEFDVVVLPELDAALSRSTTAPLPFRPDPVGRITRVFPYVRREVRSLFGDVGELQEAASQADAAALRDGLSGLYVALTRARHALHVLIKPDSASGLSTTCSGANLLRHALDLRGEPAVEGRVLHEAGDADWAGPPPATAPRPTAPATAAATVALAPPRERRPLRRVSPSALAAGPVVDAGTLLARDTSAAERGTVVHAWLERIGWIEDGEPTDEELRTAARRALAGRERAWLGELTDRFRAWLGTPALRDALGRARYPGDATVEREVPFVHREGAALVEGVVDRLVLRREHGRVVAAEVVDFKTDGLSAADEGAAARRMARYRPQLEAYRRGIAATLGLEPSAVTARLALLEAGVVLDL